MPDAISIGPVVVPPAVLSAFIALTASALLLRIPSTGSDEDRRWLRDRGSTALLAAFLTWKILPLFIYTRDIIARPALLLRLPGGRPGLLAGALVATILLVPGLVRSRSRIRPTATVALVTGVVYAMSMATVGALMTPVGSAPTAEDLAMEVEVLDGPSVPLLVGDGITVLGFWATWCGPCRAELPVKERFYRDYGENVRYLAVNMLASEAGEASVRGYARDQALPYLVVLDRGGRIASIFSVKGTPTTVVIGPDGTILDRWLGPSSYDRLSRAVEAAPVPVETASNR